MITDTSTDTLCPPEVERLVTTVGVTSETTNSNSLLPNTTSNDIQQHVNSGDVDNDSQSDWHSDPDSCAPDVMVPDARVFSSVMNEQKNTHDYMTEWYTKGIYVSFVFILPHHKNLLLLALTLCLVQYDCYSITGHPN
jgi:hypothetical protein